MVAMDDSAEGARRDEPQGRPRGSLMTAEMRWCPLCGGTARRPFLSTNVRSSSGKRFRVVTCAACSLRFTDPLPTDEELNSLYEAEYYKFAYDQPGSDTPKASSLVRRVKD